MSISAARAVALASTLFAAAPAPAAEVAQSVKGPASAPAGDANPAAAAADAKGPQAGAAEKTPPAPAAAGTQAPAPNPPNAPAPWAVYVADDESFAVEFPGKPSTEANEGGGIHVKVYSVEPGAGQPGYGVAAMTFDGVEVIPDGAVEEMRKGIVQKVAGKLARDEAVTVRGYAARDLAFDDAGTHVAIRILAVKGRLYQLLAISKEAPVPAASVRRFFDSFRPAAR